MNKRYWVLLCFVVSAAFTNAQSFTEFGINLYGGAFPSDLTVFNGKLYLAATDSTHGYEPWVTDGSSSGTQLLADIFTGTENSFPQYFTADSNQFLFFQANDSAHGQELWAYNNDSTYLVKDINPGPGASLPQNLFVLNHKLFFQADDGVHGSELWVSDGTSSGTQMLTDINTTHGDSAGSYPSGFTIFNNQLYFIADDGVHGYELWVTDGTGGGTHLVIDIYLGATGSNPTDLTVFNDALYFSANDSVDGNELWVTDGTSTRLDRDINPGYQSSSPQGLTVFNNALFFQADDGVHGPELCSITGIQTGYQLLSDIYPGSTGSYPQNFAAYAGKLFFQATDSLHGAELWTTDGSPSGTILFADLNPGPDGSYPGFFTPYHGKLYFIAQPDTVSGAQMFLTDGAGGGTGDLVFTGAPLNPLGVTSGFVPFDNGLAFSAYYDSLAGQQLWLFNDAPAAVATVNKAEAFKLYPNPCKDYYTLSGFTAGLDYRLRLTDIAGRIIQTQEIQAGGESIQFPMPQISAGIYLLEVQNNQNTSTLRMVKAE